MIQIASHSEAGGHPKNEDYFSVQRLSIGPEIFVCALADGQGGRAGGARASEVACRNCVTTAATFGSKDLHDLAVWNEVLRRADKAVCEESAAGFTTLVVFCVTPEFVCGASCGDSAVVLRVPDRPGEILTARQFKNPPVGSGEAVAVPFFARLELPSIVLGMTDGVWKYGGLDYILNLEPDRRVDEVMAGSLARARMPNGGLQDDFTLVAFQQRREYGPGGRQGTP